jgi:hypothetical protein
MRTPRFTVRREGVMLRAEAVFDEGPTAQTGTLYWSFDRPPEGSLPYEHSPWESTPMKRADERTWTGEISLPPDSKTIDLLGVHTDNVNNLPMSVSSSLLRIPCCTNSVAFAAQ